MAAARACDSPGARSLGAAAGDRGRNLAALVRRAKHTMSSIQRPRHGGTPCAAAHARGARRDGARPGDARADRGNARRQHLVGGAQIAKSAAQDWSAC